MRNCIAYLRKSFDPKMSQAKLAYLASISRTHLSDIENGKVEPGGTVMLRIAGALNKKVEQVFFINSVNHKQQIFRTCCNNMPLSQQNHTCCKNQKAGTYILCAKEEGV